MSAPTAPLPLAAADALARLEAAFLPMPLDVVRAVARYAELSALIDRLSSRESHYMTPVDWQRLAKAQGERASVYFVLARSGQLHLVERV